GFFPDPALTIEYMHKPGLVTRPIRLSQHVLNDAITCPDGYTCPIRYFLCPGFLAFHLVVRDNPAVVVLCEREISPGFVKFRAPPWTPGIHACTGGQLFSHRNRIFRLADLLGQFLQYVRSPYQANLNVFLAEFPDFRRFRNGDVVEIPGPGDVMGSPVGGIVRTQPGTSVPGCVLQTHAHRMLNTLFQGCPDVFDSVPPGLSLPGGIVFKRFARVSRHGFDRGAVRPLPVHQLATEGTRVAAPAG